jgi:hypothetical protein
MKAGLKAALFGIVAGFAIAAGTATAGTQPGQGTEQCCIDCMDFINNCTTDPAICADTYNRCVNWCQCP